MDVDLRTINQPNAPNGAVDLRGRPAAAGIPLPREAPDDQLPDVSNAVAGLAAAVRALTEEGVLPVGLDAGERPIADVRALIQALAQVEAILAMRMAAAEAGGSLPFLSAGGMASQSYWSRTRARSLSRAGHLANDRPDIEAAWLAGRITAEHVDAAAKGTTGLVTDRRDAVLDGLTALWGRVTPATVATYCARARAIVDPGPDDPDLRARKAHEARFLSFSVLDDTVHITGALPRLEGESLMNTIRGTSEKLRVAGDGLTAAQRRADALMHLASIGAVEGRAGTSAAVSITLTADLDAVTGGGFRLTDADTRFALCDPALTPVVTEPARHINTGAGEANSHGPDQSDVCHRPHLSGGAPPGVDSQRLAALTAAALAAPQPLAVGRTQRVATPAQRRALEVRDGGCILPGCEVPAAHTQIHHLQPWVDGGATDLPNLVSLCWAHHRQVELGRWVIHPIESQQPGIPANNGAPFTISTRPRAEWGAGRPGW